MSVARTPHLLFTPSRREIAWREAVMDAAHAQGVPVGLITHGTTGDVVVTDHLIPEQVDQADARDWWVFYDNLDDALFAAGDALGEHPPGAQALTHVSHRLSSAFELLRRGARLVVSSGDSVELPVLGRVQTSTPHPPSPSSSPDIAAAIAFYRTPPVTNGASATWGPERFAFPVGGALDGGAPRIDLTGRGRILMHGPYIPLPPGLWRATLRVMVDPEGGHAPLRFDWGEGDDIVSVTETVSSAGFYAISLERRWEAIGPAQARIWVAQPVFQGRLEFLDCRVEFVTDPELDLG